MTEVTATQTSYRQTVYAADYLLRETNMSISQIARVLGFSSASYFSQSFRRAEGSSPIEYRKIQSGSADS